MSIVVFDELIDLALQVRHGVEGAAADRPLRNQPEPALDLVEPGRISRGVVHMETRTARQPRFDASVPVRAVVIDDQMYIQVL